MKQADVVLLGYPVPFPLTPDIRRKNLEIYEAVTSPQGPAMTWVRSLAGSLTLLSSPLPSHMVSLTASYLDPDLRVCLLWAGWS